MISLVNDSFKQSGNRIFTFNIICSIAAAASSVVSTGNERVRLRIAAAGACTETLFLLDGGYRIEKHVIFDFDFTLDFRRKEQTRVICLKLTNFEMSMKTHGDRYSLRTRCFFENSGSRMKIGCDLTDSRSKNR